MRQELNFRYYLDKYRLLKGWSTQYSLLSYLYTVLSYLGVCIFYTRCILICLLCFLLVLSCLVCNCCWLTVCIFVVVLCVLLSYNNLLYYVGIADFFTLDAGLLAISQYSEGPATGHLDTDFSLFPCA